MPARSPTPLAEYRKKRDPAATPEPVPSSSRRPRRKRHANETFVIQEHHARALHWDVRLERDGVLVSWAVPKGLPADRDTNHLAVHTEDHPLEYATFSGEIPKGEYGGGSVTIWDEGTYETEKWSEREVMVVLHGSKGRAEGRFVLFQTRGKNWMIHRMDEASAGYEAMPTAIRPMLATSGQLPKADEGWTYEFKWDGVRAIAYVDGGRVRIESRNGNDLTGSFPELRLLGETLGSVRAVLDGEIVAFDEDGIPRFQSLQPRIHAGDPSRARRLAASHPVTYVLFDLVYLEGEPLFELPYHERRARLERLGLEKGQHWTVSPRFPGPGSDIVRASKEQGLEGILAKASDSPYRPGKRSPEWTKVKNVLMQEVVVGGWTPGQGRRTNQIGSLLLGIPEKGGLRYIGQVGTGFDEEALADLRSRLTPLVRRTSPFVDEVPSRYARSATWTEPRLVGEVSFGEWTKDGRLRHPSWRGVRDDKEPSEVVCES